MVGNRPFQARVRSRNPLRQRTAAPSPSALLLLLAAPSVILVAFNTGCESDPTGPPEARPVLEWSVDHLPLLDFRDVWVSEGGEVFLAGDRAHRGVVARFDGTSLMELPTGEAFEDFHAITGTSSTNILAATRSEIIRYDGSDWALEVSGANYLNDIWMDASGEAFAVGAGGLVLHFDGTSWAEEPRLECNNSGVWGSSPEDVWVVGGLCWYAGLGVGGGGIYHFDGQHWTPVDVPPSGHLLIDVWGSTPDDVFTVGRYGRILHFDGTGWEELESGGGGPWLEGIWGRAGDDVFAVGGEGIILRYDGSTWREVRLGDEYLKGVWGRPDGEIYAVGYDESILRFDGADWTVAREVPEELRPAKLWGASSNNLFGVGGGNSGRVVRYRNGQWSATETLSSSDFFGVWGTSSSNVWVVGSDVFRFDGVGWEDLSMAEEHHRLYGVWSPGPNRALAVGGAGDIFRYDGSSWSRMESGTTETLLGIWGSSWEDVYAVGLHGTVLHFDGDGWTPEDVGLDPESSLSSVWGTGKSNVYIGGDGGTLLHFDGEAWEPQAIPGLPDVGILGFWGASKNDIYAVGRGGTVLWFDGSSWTDVSPVDLSMDFEGVWLDETSDVIVTGSGAIYRGHR